MDHYRLLVDEPGSRLDLFVSRLIPELSRSRVQALINGGFIRLDGRPAKAAARLKPGQVVEVEVPEPEPALLEPEPMELAVIFEDEALVVLNKPPGLVVHPAPGHASGTLVHGLLHHCPDLKGIGGERRPGIVHRLDKETSGLIVAVKSDQAHQRLSRAFKAKKVDKTYRAVLLGRPGWSDKTVEAPIGRHPTKRKQMAVLESGRPAVSLFRVVEEFAGPLVLAEVDLMTGRTHQIRVHAAHLGHPILGDPVYGSGSRERRLEPEARALAAPLGRQMLHAWRLGFDHPLTGQRLAFEAPYANDMRLVIEELQKTAGRPKKERS